jgi:hypothetical protein
MICLADSRFPNLGRPPRWVPVLRAPWAGRLAQANAQPAIGARSTLNEEVSLHDGAGVTGFQQRRKISSILILNTVEPTAVRMASGN